MNDKRKSWTFCMVVIAFVWQTEKTCSTNQKTQDLNQAFATGLLLQLLFKRTIYTRSFHLLNTIYVEQSTHAQQDMILQTPFANHACSTMTTSQNLSLTTLAYIISHKSISASFSN